MCLLAISLLSAGIGHVGSLGIFFVSVLRFGTVKSDAVIDGDRGIQEARREGAIELVGVGLR